MTDVDWILILIMAGLLLLCVVLMLTYIILAINGHEGN